MNTKPTKDEVARIVSFEESNPHAILGPHEIQLRSGKEISVRAYLPRAVKAWLNVGNSKLEMKRIHRSGFYEAHLPAGDLCEEYSIEFADSSGFIEVRGDPYRFRSKLTDFDLWLFGEGREYRSYEKLGAHLLKEDDVKGVRFAVWSPNARSVSVVGDFNHWIVGAHPMGVIGRSGIWGLFIPGLKEGENYKYAIKSLRDGQVRLKGDPYSFRAETRPRTASFVTGLDYRWGDAGWLSDRSSKDWFKEPISIYEVHLGSWRKREGSGFLDYRELADLLIPYVKDTGFTHIELLPVMEHPLDDSWGYQTSYYFSPTSRYGTPEEFMYFIDKCHQNRIGAILDWVPAHFPKDDFALAMFDGTHLYNHEDQRLGEHPEWGTYLFNYGRSEVKNFLISNALFWFDKYHIDGLRVDAVASMLYLDYSRKQGEWIPNKYGGRENLEAIDFMRELNEVVHRYHPHALMIAEESTAWPHVTGSTYYGGLGFDLKWDMGWMHDTLEYFSKDPVFRSYHHNSLTFSMLYAFNERFISVLSHDEVVYGKRSLLNKMPGDEWQKFANLRLLLGYMFTHTGKKLLFMGGEFGQWDEWHFKKELDWNLLSNPLHSKLQSYVKDLNRIYSEEKALHELDCDYQGFEWIDCSDTMHSVISYLRKAGQDDFLVIVLSMTPVPRHDYRIGVPKKGFYREILNSDASEYGGSGIGNRGGVDSEEISWHGRPHSLKLTLPPLGMLIFKLTQNPAE
ncbi:MAG: 1,4-alpha-glucan branching protein GlgB [Thermoplasmata archaeon]|nr:MAG: 1,4-alpha-glucan branching protein GlgB [Thermoplasmata archaeon]